MIKKLFVLFMFAMILGACNFKAPDTFTKEEKVQYTTLETLKSAKIFREFALESAGSLYKKGLMDDSTKDKIIRIGDELQGAINGAADALKAYKEAGSLGDETPLDKKIKIYQKLFNEFMEIVTPYVLDISTKEGE